MVLCTSPKPSIVEVLSGHATRDPDAAAILWSRDGRVSFGDLDRHIRQIGLQLRAAGVAPGSRVGIALARGPEAAVLSVAVCCTAVLVPLDPNVSEDELHAGLKSLRLDALIVSGDGGLPPWVSAAGEGCTVFTIAGSALGSAELALRQVTVASRARPALPSPAHSWAAILRTSGTTGTSKWVPVTHENLLAMAMKMERWLELTPADRSACIMPIYYNAGLKATLLVPLLIGCSVALPASPAPRDFGDWSNELRPTWLTAAPPFLQSVVEKLRGQSGDALASSLAPSLRFVLSTASYLPPATKAELEALLRRPVLEFYGLSEAGMMTAPVLPPARATPGTVGRIPPDELAIRDDKGIFLPPGRAGEVVVRGPSVTPGYLLDDIESAPSGLEDGWLPTGDLGIVDSEGLLTIIGRRKEIVNRGGEKVSPYQVEGALLRHPAVREAAVFPIPHPRLGETVGAAVVLRSAASVTSRELLEFICDRVAHFEMPRHIHIVDSLPVGPTGKVSRPQLSKTHSTREEPKEAPVAPLETLIAEIWQRLLKRGDIGLDDDFLELGGDSLQATEMLLELEELTHHPIAPSEVRVQLTIRHLAETLAGAVAAKREVVTCARSGEGTPLFLWHGDCLGWGLYAFRLASLLKGSGPVYLLHSILDGNEGIETIEDMVRIQLPHIEAVAPSGPIRLAGFCHGGHAALETAARLERAGRTIESITLIDTFSLNARPFVRLIAPFISLAHHILPGRAGARLRRDGMLALWILIQLLQGDRSIAGRVTRQVRKGTVRTWHSSLRATYFRAMSQYIPRKLQAEIVCLLCEEMWTRKAYAAGAWRRLSTSVRCAPIPGEHHTCVSRHFGELAACLNRMISPAP